MGQECKVARATLHMHMHMHMRMANCHMLTHHNRPMPEILLHTDHQDITVLQEVLLDIRSSDGDSAIILYHWLDEHRLNEHRWVKAFLASTARLYVCKAPLSPHQIRVK